MRLTFLLAAALMLAACSHPENRMDRVEHIMLTYAGDVPGASLLVVRNGEPLVKRGWGMADMEHDMKASPATNYRLASITKQFTAAGILLLVEEGTLSLHDPLRRWLPELPEVTAPITLEQVLTHTSGLVDYESLMAAGYQGQISGAEVLELLAAADSLYFQPGSTYRYSNTGYVLLGLVIERASGLTLPKFLKKRIFTPLGMSHTLLYEHNRGPEVLQRAYGYSYIDGAWVRTDQSATSATRGDGGIYSSINDLAKWDAALYDDRLLSDASRKAAFSPHVKVTGEGYEASYGYGWRITGDSLWHSGETMGFRNVIVRWPGNHLSVILLSNRKHPKPYKTALAIGELYLGDG